MSGRVCRQCGGEINDLSIHPKARTCKACRIEANRKNGNIHKNKNLDQQIVPIVYDYLERSGWPKNVSASRAFFEEPALVEKIYPTNKPYAKTLFSWAAKTVVGPQGQRYISWSMRGRTLQRISPTDENQMNEVTA